MDMERCPECGGPLTQVKGEEGAMWLVCDKCGIRMPLALALRGWWLRDGQAESAKETNPEG